MPETETTQTFDKIDSDPNNQSPSHRVINRCQIVTYARYVIPKIKLNGGDQIC